MSLSELAPDEAARVTAALRAMRERASPEPVAPSQPRYELTVHDGSDVRRIVLYQSLIPTELRPLVDALLGKM